MARRRRRERDTLEFIDAARRFIRRAGERVADADEFELAELVALRDDLEAAIRVAVTGQRSYGRSWAYIGAALGITRQSAQERYAERVTVVQDLANQMSGDISDLALAAVGLTNQQDGGTS